MNYEIKKLKKMSDERGYLIEFLKNSELDGKKEFGQNYFVTFDGKGVVRGNHYHKKKSEWFSIAFGKAEVKMKDVKSGEEMKITLSDQENYLTRLYIGPNVAHSFKSLTKQAVLLNYTDKEYDIKTPDTYFYELAKQ